MSIKASFYQFLLNDSGIAAIAGNRIWHLVVPNQAFDGTTKRPGTVYRLDDRESSQTFCGVDSLRNSRFSVDHYAKTSEQADALAQATADALEDFSGDMEGTQVSAVFLENEFDPDPDLDPGLFRVHQVYSVWHY